MPIQLNAEWSDLMNRYSDDHSDPRNQACHRVGIPLIVASFPVGATLIGLPLAGAMFSVGWTFQFVGHYFEGKKPSFVDDKRNLLVGVLWWLKKSGVPIDLAPGAATWTKSTSAPGYGADAFGASSSAAE